MQVDDTCTGGGTAHAEKGQHPARVVAMPVREDHGVDGVHRCLHRGGVANEGCGVGSGVEEDAVFVLPADLGFLFGVMLDCVLGNHHGHMPDVRSRQKIHEPLRDSS